MTSDVRFDRNARYGAALAGVMFACYLNVTADFGAFIQAANYAGSLGTDAEAVDFVQFVLIVVLYLASFILVPTSPARRVAAVTLASVVLFTWATIGIERGIGNIVEPIDFWTFVVDQGWITLIVGLGGWLIVRARHPLSYIVLLCAIVPPFISRALIDVSVTSGAFILVSQATVVVLGIGGAWLAVLIDSFARRRSAARKALSPAV